MTGRRHISGILSIVAMGVLASVLLAMVSNKEVPPTKAQQAVEEVKPPQSSRKVVLATVTLPPPPALAIAHAIKDKTLAITKPPGPGAFMPLKPLPSTRLTKAVTKAVVPRQPASESNGRVLLRLLEFGKGPSIEILWPVTVGGRARLYKVFTKCFGMKTALLDARNRLYISDGVSGQVWQPNIDKFSTFMRRPSGEHSKAEDREITKIRNWHDMANGIPIRLFPRRVDAVLLAGLKQLVGNKYKVNTSIVAQYQMTGNGVSIDHISINGQERGGKIVLPPVRHCNL